MKNKDKKTKYFKLGELFCGPGGVAYGALNAESDNCRYTYSIKHGWANDYDKDTCDTYIRNICPSTPDTVIHGDVRELDIKTLSKIDAFAYGFPCNDFSIVGEQKGINGKFGPLYSYGVKIINEFKPKFFVAENVGGIRSSNSGSSFKRIVKDLMKAGNGYDVAVHLFKSEEYGVPQSRHRVLIVGIDKKLKLEYKVPAPTTVGKHVSVRRALESPPIRKGFPNNEFTRQSAQVIERLKHIEPGQNAWNADLPKNLRLNVKGAKLSHIYRRLDPRKPSYTLTGSGGGGTHCYHWKENRALTNRERARIQTFPDNFIFEGTKESVRKQIGMAVPPKLSEVIFKSVLDTFAGNKYKAVDANLSYILDE